MASSVTFASVKPLGRPRYYFQVKRAMHSRGGLEGYGHTAFFPVGFFYCQMVGGHTIAVKISILKRLEEKTPK